VVAFSSQGDRIALTQIEQMTDGKYVLLGYYDTQSDNLTWNNKEKWIGICRWIMLKYFFLTMLIFTGGKVPQDRTIVRRVLRTVSLTLFISMGVVSVVGILWAIALVIFNIAYRHRRVIQTSHPVCNTIMLVGVCLCLGCQVLMGGSLKLSPILLSVRPEPGSLPLDLL
jgi:gamma-aminobutyric acid type B receptor